MKCVQRALHALLVVTAALLLGPWQSAAANSLQDLGDSSPAALRAPHVFVVYWGPEWTQGFTSNSVTSAQYRNYLESFLGALGGSRLLGTQTQYGAGNPFDLFAGQVRFFPTEPPATPTLDDIENVVQLSQQWNALGAALDVAKGTKRTVAVGHAPRKVVVQQTAAVRNGANVSIANLAFASAEVVIETGQSMSWSNDDGAPHGLAFRDEYPGTDLLLPGARFIRT